MNIYYTSKYRKKPFIKKWHGVLISVLEIISKTKLSKFLSFADKHHFSSLNKTKDFNKLFLDYSKKKINLRKIDFIDVCEIDNIETIESHILQIIRKNKFFTLFGKGRKLAASEITKIRKDLTQFAKKYRRAYQGKLFELINEDITEKNDLYEYINFSYFKSFENLFVIKLSVKPSKKFFNILDSIQECTDIPNDTPIISHFKDFLRKGRIFAGYRTAGNQKAKAFENLIYDLNFQLKEPFLQGFKGVFSDNTDLNPFITYFNTQSQLDYDDFNKGFGIVDTSYISDTYFDQNIGYYLNSFWYSDNNQKAMYVIGENDSFPLEHDSIKEITQYSFSNTILRSWAILNYLANLHEELNSIRGNVYSFINSKNKISFRKQIALKVKLSEKKIKFKRIQKEFSKRNIQWYLTDQEYETKKLCAINRNWNNDINYYSFAKSNIDYFIKDNNSQICELDEYFNEVSSINNIKLNYRFQIIAIGLTILGLILALTNVEDIIKMFKSLIK